MSDESIDEAAEAVAEVTKTVVDRAKAFVPVFANASAGMLALGAVVVSATVASNRFSAAYQAAQGVVE